MDEQRISNLILDYKNAPKEFQVTQYWAEYEKGVLDILRAINLSELRSGKYPILSTFGFNDSIYNYHPNLPTWKRLLLKFVHKFIIRDRSILPYKIRSRDIQEMAYQHCNLVSMTTDSLPLSEIEASSFGSPQDLFEINGRKYTVPFLNFFRRYCFAHKHMKLSGHEVIVELGSGSGYQVEVLKKLYPNLTVLCFDLPAQLYLCESYLRQALIGYSFVGSEETRQWRDLSGLQKGSVHFFGNWQMPLLAGFNFDIFWNAASFGEMEPEVVSNYLSYVKGGTKWIYLLQARHGKETTGKVQVATPITLDDYKDLLSGYMLCEEQDAWHAHKRMAQSGGYFEGVWLKE